ncbi:nuclear transport factor 2 family protein [Siccirubricoccus sp. KC 17139]|uniref:Nuclear transport factor 2 family protein n=1 Tax=Siccirubricoccus soli TaxID=2899147 RepID=A0ABT1D6Z5_9PROT|nr:nuclear transport factor 2 family protein [Siccirubricoccus soli]MCO6417040.1 nuclear transport factor 2 family protein [Siccirubricoccus soli]MCP2683175.1 nuclear transport factor 2 family protein [Siccirubricoccus soli]
MPDASGKPMAASTVAEIEQVIQTYFDGLYEGDAEKLAAAFHPCSHLYWAKDGGVGDLPREEWLAAVRSRPSAKSKGLARDDRILLMDISGPETAFVKVACQLPPRYFTDYLVLNRTEAGWKIVSKVYRFETRD